MNRLPQEIYDEIAAWDSKPSNLTDLATISRPWQMAVERITFRQIYLKSSDLDRFERIVRGRRRGFLGVILYSIVLPTHSEAVHGRREAKGHHQANYEAFLSAIHCLFSILKSWDDVECHIRLEILDVYSLERERILHPVPRQEPNAIAPHTGE
jgi:hypothetical protein